MDSKNKHAPETHSYPADKMLPDVVHDLGQTGRKIVKKVHNKRSRRYRKLTLSEEVSNEVHDRDRARQ